MVKKSVGEFSDQEMGAAPNWSKNLRVNFSTTTCTEILVKKSVYDFLIKSQEFGPKIARPNRADTAKCTTGLHHRRKGVHWVTARESQCSRRNGRFFSVAQSEAAVCFCKDWQTKYYLVVNNETWQYPDRQKFPLTLLPGTVYQVPYCFRPR